MDHLRRNFIKSSLFLGGMILTDPINRIRDIRVFSTGSRKSSDNLVPRKGETFNESFVFPDEATGRLTRRLTSFRQFNQKPTYHLSSGFSKDDRYLVFCTWNPGGASALIRSDITTGDCWVIDRAGPDERFQFTSGNSLEIIPNTDLTVIRYGQFIRIYHLQTGEIVQDISSNGKGFFSGAAGTCDGKHLIVIRNDHDFDYRRDNGKKDPNKALGYNILRVDLDTGDWEDLFRDEAFRGGHSIPSPVNPDLLLYHRDSSPKFGHGGDYGKTSRDWILNMRTSQLTEIRPRDPSKFTWHGNWSHKGDHIYYHGPSGDQSMREKYEEIGSPYKDGPGTRHFIGVAAMDGSIVWEKQYPYLYYGHVSSHRLQNTIIIDNLLAYEFLSGIHWEERDADGNPRIELLAKHNSTYAPGAQTRHPHSQMTSDGKWISYNAQFDDRSDVYVVKMS